MTKIRCSVCDGWVVNGRCTSCGMYYREETGRYYLNERSPETEPVRLNAKPEHEVQWEEAEEEKKENLAAKLFAAEKKRLAEEKKKAEERRKQDLRRAREITQGQAQGTAASAEKRRAKKKEEQRLTQTSAANANLGGGAASWKSVQHRANGAGKQRANGAGKGWHLVALFLVIFILVQLVTSFADDFDTTDWSDIDEAMEVDASGGDTPEDWYQGITLEIPEEGETWEGTLEAGYYQVGVQIPEGSYRMSTSCAGMYLAEWSEDGEISWLSWFLYDYRSEGKQEFYETEDIRLYAGAYLQVTGSGTLQMYTENGQTEDLWEAVDNPLADADPVAVEDGQTITVGEDIEAGVYDLSASGGYVYLDIQTPDGYWDSISLEGTGESEWDSAIFRNVKLEEGTQISCEDTDGTSHLLLIPSEQIYVQSADA